MAPVLGNDAIHWYMGERTSRIVAESGIPSDRFHLGKIILRTFKDYPDAVTQIDGATDESVTNASMLEKSVKCATCFRNLGLGPGDVIVLMAPNHVTLSVPFYAALYTGITIAAVDRTLGVMELQSTLIVRKPKIIFCQSDKVQDIQMALKEIELNTRLVTFDEGEGEGEVEVCNYSEFIQKYEDDTPVDEFIPTDFEPEKTTAFLLGTSGSTGLPKAAEILHKNFVIAIFSLWSRSTKFPTPTRMSLCTAPIQWLTTIFITVIFPILKITRLHSSMPLTPEHAFQLINTYKPTFLASSPTLIKTLFNTKNSEFCNFSCFEYIILLGSAASKGTFEEVKRAVPKAEVFNGYGLSEVCGIIFHGDSSLTESCGKPMGNFQYRLIDIETQVDINEAHVPGELLVKGPSVFKGYYNNIEATKETFLDDGWFKTGDMFYRDEHLNYYFVERVKLLLKYKNHQISPMEVENVIRQHPGVLDVAVTGVPDPECGELPVACVVKREGSAVTPDDIKKLVKDSLSDAKQLRGGVVFLKSIPLTASFKVNQKLLKKIAQTSNRL